MRKSILLGVITTLLISSNVTAQLNRLGFENNYRITSEDFKPKNRTIALSLTLGVPIISSIVGTRSFYYGNEVIGTSIIITGLLFGPSTGNMYTRNSKDVWRGISRRFVASGVMLVGSAFLFQPFCSDSCYYNPGNLIIGFSTFYTGVGLYLYSMYLEVRNSLRNVDRFNVANSTQISFAPVYFSNFDRMGIGLNFSF